MAIRPQTGSVRRTRLFSRSRASTVASSRFEIDLGLRVRDSCRARSQPAQLLEDARNGRRRVPADGSNEVAVGLSRPLVHEELLDLDGQHARRVREGLVSPAAVVAAPKPDVLAHVERAAREVERREIGHEPIDDRGPAAAIGHRAGADVDLRVGLRVGLGRVRPVAPMVVGVKVEDHEAAVARRKLRVELVEGRVEGVVLGQGSSTILGWELSVPDLESPRVVRASGRRPSRAAG